ncbi:DENN domain-containing protein 1A-like isoform X2 [Limulus polyphemus]|uniref:DENN domain-containing protein 1A-like isoform X2 n=1 Tax=Limulus polyphemus TaxID=6850 RepID=A0ABM1C497_LIMPO|nr:DENN domain-containing protein 1A-like isoform X2 [Limulus polyphemus]
MGSRIRENPAHVFDCFCEISVPTRGCEVASIQRSYPEKYSEEEILKSVPEFAFPCEFTIKHVQHFSFILTNIDSRWTFGYCRHAPDTPTSYVFLSALPWHETFYRLLNYVSEIASKNEEAVWTFLGALYHIPVPNPGHTLHVLWDKDQNQFVAQCPDHRKLPAIPENRNLMEYFSAVDVHNMIMLFASLLHERRIVITSKRLSRLTACVQAASVLLYPMQWQHIIIPVLPVRLLDYLSAPMPFLIGVSEPTMSQVDQTELGEVVLLDADANKIYTPFDDLQTLPGEIITSLKKNLKNPNAMLGDGVARAFLRAMVQLIGGYRVALKLQLGEKISFDPRKFIQSRPSMQTFLEKILNLQLFQQFIEGRLELLNSGKGFHDEFEFEVNNYEDKNASGLTTQYKEWLFTMKKGSGAFFKSVKSKFKDRSKQVYKDFRVKAHEKHHKDSIKKKNQDDTQPKSAPSSPTLHRNRHTVHATSKIKYTSNTRFSSTRSVKELKAENSSTSRLQQMKLLDVNEYMEGTENSMSDNDTSPSPSLQRINLDLMGDLQDLIFSRQTHGSLESIAASSATSDSTSVDLVQPSSSMEKFYIDFLSSQDDLTHDNRPIPPPRSKRRNQLSLAAMHQSSKSQPFLDKVKSKSTSIIQLQPLISDKKVDQINPHKLASGSTKSLVVSDKSTANSQDLSDALIKEKLNRPTTCPVRQQTNPVYFTPPVTVKRLENGTTTQHFNQSKDLQGSSYISGESSGTTPSPLFSPTPANDLELLKKYGLNFSSLPLKSPGASVRPLSSCTLSPSSKSTTWFMSDTSLPPKSSKLHLSSSSSSQSHSLADLAIQSSSDKSLKESESKEKHRKKLNIP